MSVEDGAYHTLLARHDAMRLRRRLLSPGGAPEETGTGAASPASDEAYDGTADQHTILRTLDLVAPFDQLITRLYEALFARHPALRSLFPASMEFQQAHLARALWYLVEHLDRPETIAERFEQLGRDHRKLGVRPAQYAAFEAALCEALRARAGERWTPELEEAWVRMLRCGVRAMVRGADSALREPASWRATVTRHQLLTPGLAVLRARPHETYRYRPGQHATVESARLPHAWRPYHLAGAPRADGEVEFHIRMTGPGGVSEALVEHTAAGDEIRLGPPKGALALGDTAGHGELLLVAWDTGWAAAKALLHQLDQQPAEPRQTAARPPVRLLLGADEPSGPYDREYVAGFAEARPWLTVVPVSAGAPGEGRYDRLARAATRSGGPAPGRALLAGPPAMVRAVASALTRAGLPAERLCHDPLPPGLHAGARPAPLPESPEAHIAYAGGKFADRPEPLEPRERSIPA
ncbi:globin domain-containing protein [Streptomyces cacaoi]|uniref:globin domain-containing protein n=1 Tax=Streptomyces cacaoi TaxID=1898 RepID=UPI0011F379B7|nr:globin domain-containing protein [Streptomyces cacaoi]